MMWYDALLDLFFPPSCPFCGRVGVRGVCGACEKTLPWTKKPLHEGAGFSKCAVPLRYEGAVRKALLRLKFSGARGVAEGCGALLGQCAAEELGGEFDVVTWAPVSRGRLRERGYDQARLLAVSAARLWDTKPLALLEKTRDTPAQSTLRAEERRANVLGVYSAAQPERIRGARVLLIDDILTTGSTLAECARVLREAGAAGVVCACVAVSEVSDGPDRSSAPQCPRD